MRAISLSLRLASLITLLALGISVWAPPGFAQEAVTEVVAEQAAAEEEAELPYILASDIDALWTCLAAFLVFFMQAGFCLVESGFTRAKNTGNIVMKNMMDLSIGSVSFWLLGFGLMFGASSGWFGTSLFAWDAAWEEASSFDWAFLIFQTVFCATAATIVSGAMAERTKFQAYLIYTALITIVVYPIFGSWCWNGLIEDTGSGWLEDGPFGLPAFYDFAGSTVVHSVGAWAALAGAIVVGPRMGKYVKGKVVPIPGHSMLMGAMGVFILWLGWFGFNPGSTTAVGGGSFARIAVTTNLSAACGAIGGMITAWLLFKKPDISFTLNGALAGLVGITAGCDAVSETGAAMIGLIAGVLVVFSCLFFDKIRVDDPVGAISVHGVCGAWGTLAVGLFAKDGMGLFYGGGVSQFLSQLVGVAAGFAWAFTTSLGIFLVIKYTVGLRVSEQEELEGLDIHEHGIYAYPPQFVVDQGVGIPAGMPVGYSPSPATVPVVAAE